MMASAMDSATALELVVLQQGLPWSRCDLAPRAEVVDFAFAGRSLATLARSWHGEVVDLLLGL